MIADMHCDSILKVSAERGMISDYNVSAREPYLQFFALFTPARGQTPEERRKRLIRLLDVYLYETRRCRLIRADGVAELNRAIDLRAPAALLSLEGGGGLFADSEELTTLYRAGLRAWFTAKEDEGPKDRRPV